MQKVSMLIAFGMLIFAGIFLAGCGSDRFKSWTGFYYSDINRMSDEGTWKIQPGFDTLEDCREWVHSIANVDDNYDYECGYGCRYEKDIKMNVCKETQQ